MLYEVITSDIADHLSDQPRFEVDQHDALHGLGLRIKHCTNEGDNLLILIISVTRYISFDRMSDKLEDPLRLYGILIPVLFRQVPAGSSIHLVA